MRVLFGAEGEWLLWPYPTIQCRLDIQYLILLQKAYATQNLKTPDLRGRGGLRRGYMTLKPF